MTGRIVPTMTNYTGRATNNPAEIAAAQKRLADFRKEWPVQNPLPAGCEDNGACDNEHPDSGWCRSFNASQRGVESLPYVTEGEE